MTRPDHDMLRDRMPDVASGVSRWSAEEQGHLDGCADCRAEWELLAAARRLGAAVEREYDGAGAARVVAARWRLHPTGAEVVRRRVFYSVLTAAAAILLVILGTQVLPSRSSDTPASPIFLTELDSLTTDELVLVADGLDVPFTQLEMLEEAPLSDLDTVQLGRVLRSLEG